MSRIMRKRMVCLTAFLLAIGCTMAGQHASAETMAIQDWSGNMGYTTQYKGVTAGYEFTVGTDPITVTKLGFFDYGANGLSESHDVGIWEVGNSTALVTATVTTTSLLEGPTIAGAGQFRFVELSSTVELSANTSYRIGAYFSSDHSDAWAHANDANASQTVASAITYLAPRYKYDSGLSYPDQVNNRVVGYLGPNFQFVPEPGTFGLLLSVGAVALGMFVRRRRSR